MRKRIGVFIGEIAQDYQKIVTKCVSKRANELGYDTVFICSYGSYNEDIIYALGEKSCMYLPDISGFDGLIIAEDVFDIAGMADELYGLVKEKANCPVVYLRTTREGYYSVLPENRKSMEKMVRHFTDDHGFRDICYMSGKKGYKDANERLEGFLTVMKEHGIEVTDNMIFHGNYWRNKSAEALDWFMQGRDTYPQAIVCANDYMALSICEELKKRGVKIPEDVCVSGFDFLDEAKLNNPSLTSLEVDFEAMVINAVNIIHDTNNNVKRQSVNANEAILRLNRSCGCGSQHEIKELLKVVDYSQRQYDDTKNSFVSVTEYQDSVDFDEYMVVADRYRRFLRADKAYFCFCDESESGYGEVENDSTFTEQVILRRIFENPGITEKTSVKFSRKKILPDELWEEKDYNNFCVFVLHFKNKVYGYVVTTIPEEKWFDIYTQGYLMSLANAIHNCDIQSQMEKLEVIKDIYQKDALTGILNRRGFDKLFQESFAKAKIERKNIALASIDMDNLKVINDNFGHSEGDKALIILANALSSVLKTEEFCARVGGDEFAAVLNAECPERVSDFKNDFANALKRESEVTGRYLVGASVGICESTEKPALSLVACVQTADRRMYEDKRSRKAGR